MAGGLGALALLAKNGELNPKAQAYYEYFQELKKVNRELQTSYRKVLEVYYELKKKSANPKLSESVGEFHSNMYEEFKSQMDTDPRLKNNLFLEKLREFPRGAKANDVFQRNMTYASDRVKASFAAKGLQFQIAEILNEAMQTMSNSLNSALIIFGEVSRKSGYPANSMSSEQLLKTRRTYKIGLRAVREGSIEKVQQMNRPSPQGGTAVRDAVGVMGVAVAGAGVVVKTAAVTKCAEKWGIALDKSETLDLAWIADVQGGATSKDACADFKFTTGLDDLMQKPLTSNVRKFLCAAGEKIANEQDRQLSEQIQTEIKENPNCERSWTVKTSKGNVQVELNGVNEWDFGRFKASNPDLEAYLNDKLKGPMSALQTRSRRISPDAACQAEAQGSSEKAFCELSKSFFTYGQVSEVHQMMCRRKDAPNRKLSPKGAI